MRRIAAALALSLLALPLQGQAMRQFSASHRRGNTTALAVRVNFSAGTLHLGAAPTGELYRMDLAFDADRFAPVAGYTPATGSLTLGTTPVGDAGIRVMNRSQLAQRAAIELAPDIPLQLDVNLGAGFGEIELGGLRLRTARIRTAGSRTTVSARTRNAIPCGTLDLDAGASELTTEHLGNLRCAEIRSEGGVGRVTLDLTGAWTDALRVRARMALGELHLVLPRDAGVAIALDRTLTTFQPAGFTRKGSSYTSANFGKAHRTIQIDISTAVGGIVTEWAGEGSEK